MPTTTFSSVLTPPTLKKGDTVGIIAPAGKIDPTILDPAINTFKSWGLQVKLGKHILGQHHNFSGTPTQRIADLQAMLDDTSVQTILCARGGYGTLQILDDLDFSQFTKQPKWVIGFSDITALLNHIYQVHGIQSIHGPMASSFSQDADGVESLRKILFGEPLHYSEPGHPLNNPGKASGNLVGGNLSILTNLTGSISSPDTTQSILLIEDINEYYYNIDRMLLHLKRAAKFNHLAGLLVGGFTDLKDNKIPFGKSIPQIILDHTQSFDFPVAFDVSFGHIARNLALPIGRKVNLTVTSSAIELKTYL